MIQKLLYADDTSLAYASINLDDITKSMSAELKHITKWLHGNELTLYVAIATSMIIGINRKLHQNSGELIQAHFKISEEATEQKNLQST